MSRRKAEGRFDKGSRRAMVARGLGVTRISRRWRKRYWRFLHKKFFKLNER